MHDEPAKFRRNWGVQNYGEKPYKIAPEIRGPLGLDEAFENQYLLNKQISRSLSLVA